MRIPPIVLLLTSFLPALTQPAESESLRFRFIGNEAFEITDGETTLLTDFPYRSGSFGYMAYGSAELRPRENAVCLITHRHLDHFDPDLLASIGCTLVAPKQVTGKLPDVQALPLEDEIQFGPLRIQPIATPHQELEHYSYLVTWHGMRLYFTGDTGSATELLGVKDLDVLFVTPWLAQRVLRAGRKLPAKKKVVYHHSPGEKVSGCRDCVVPRQGVSFELSQ